MSLAAQPLVKGFSGEDRLHADDVLTDNIPHAQTAITNATRLSSARAFADERDSIKWWADISNRIRTAVRDRILPYDWVGFTVSMAPVTSLPTGLPPDRQPSSEPQRDGVAVTRRSGKYTSSTNTSTLQMLAMFRLKQAGSTS